MFINRPYSPNDRKQQTQTKGSTTREAKRQQQETERQQQMLNDSDKRPRIDDEKLSKSWRMLPCCGSSGDPTKFVTIQRRVGGRRWALQSG
ncbi:hypothetical protein PGT21_028243 [Puccinia graminis f. sp. tritici]|uniref:Uncharacterized protein n=1 Tax=Puccinia graminis f. sp. tritici TaxID=56615 RepID=A0A5B0NDD4_PUCGR|nr:hypothetical protein PGT21_028243 [Puccinia graminis f. sp. tritici]